MKSHSFSNAIWILLPLLAYTALACLLTPELFLGGFRLDERFLEYIPWRVEAGRQLGQGMFPFFTSKVFGGMPLFSTSYTGVLYPLNWLYAVFPPKLSQALSLFHTAAGAMGMYVYLRSRRLVPFVAFAGGLFFLCNTFFLMHASHVSMREAALLAPWVVWLSRRVLLRPGPRRAGVLALAIAVHIAIGYQQIYLFTVLWIGVEWIASLRLNQRGIRQTAWLAAGGIVGTALLAVQILPALKLMEHTPRAAMTVDEWQLSPFNPSHALIFFSPRVFGLDLNDFMGDGYLAEIHATIPSAAWALALLSIALLFFSQRFRRGGQGRTTIVYTAAMAAAFLLAIGPHTPGYELLFHVPPFSLFRIPARYLFLANTFAVILAAGGLQHLLRLAPLKRWLLFNLSWLAWGVICFTLFFALKEFPRNTNVSQVEPFEQALIGSTVHAPQMTIMLNKMQWPAFGGLLDKTGVHVFLSLLAGVFLLVPKRLAVLAGVAWLLLFGADQRILEKHAFWDAAAVPEVLHLDQNPLFDGTPPATIQRLYAFSHNGQLPSLNALSHNTFLYTGVRSLSGYCPLINAMFSRMAGISSIGQTRYDGWMLENPAFPHHLAVSHIVVDKARFSPAERTAYARGLGHVYTPITWYEDLVLLKMASTRPRFDFARAWFPAGETDDPWEADRYIRGRDPAREDALAALLENAPEDRLPPRDKVAAPGTIEVLRDEPSFQKLRVNAPQGGVLLVRDVYWPGWSYKINGAEKWRGKAGRANAILRYVPVPRGESVVTLRFRPPGWTAGLLVSAAAAAILCLLFALAKPYERWAKRKKRSLADLRRDAATLLPWTQTRKG